MKNRKIDRNKTLDSHSLPTSKDQGKGFVRILGGQWKRTRLEVQEHDGLRPTGERVRETVFDWLSHLLGTFEDVHVLDMFAGSGAMGFEAASRGAQLVWLIEKNRFVAQQLSKNIDKLKANKTMTLLKGDSIKIIEQWKNEKVDLIFIDPPFEESLQIESLKIAKTCLSKEGIIYVESPQKALDENELLALGFVKVRQAKAGQVCFELLALCESQKALLRKIK